MRLCLINLKGGSGKTTSSIFLATVLAEQGSTLLVDAEAYGSALSWTEAAGELPFVAVQMPVNDVHKRVAVLGKNFEHVVIDNPAIVCSVNRSSLKAADIALIPLSPNMVDVDRLRETKELIDEVREVYEGLSCYVLLTRVRRGTKSARDTRAVLLEFGFTVLDAEIPLLERYGGAFGTVPKGEELTEYQNVLIEIAEREAEQ